MSPTPREQFLSEGYQHVPNALDAETVQLALDCWNWSIANPGPGSNRLLQEGLIQVKDINDARNVDIDETGYFYSDIASPDSYAVYEPLVKSEPVISLVQKFLVSENVWFLGEQVFFKEGDTPPTPWHQDISDISAYGDDLLVIRVPLDSLDAETSLAVLPRSHHGPVYSSSYSGYKSEDIPQPESGEWVSFPCEPGDVLVFHLGCLHGGAPTREGQIRRALALRFVGDKAYFTSRGREDDPRNGQPYRHPRLQQLVP